MRLWTYIDFQFFLSHLFIKQMLNKRHIHSVTKKLYNESIKSFWFPVVLQKLKKSEHQHCISHHKSNHKTLCLISYFVMNVQVKIHLEQWRIAPPERDTQELHFPHSFDSDVTLAWVQNCSSHPLLIKLSGSQSKQVPCLSSSCRLANASQVQACR